MGTEIVHIIKKGLKSNVKHVKFNNPLMGTEIKIKPFDGMDVF